MITIQIRNGKAQVSGEFDLGYMGLYKDSQIDLNGDGDSLRRWWVVRDRVGEDASDEAVAACLTEYFNAFERKIQQNRKQVNDCFLIRVYFDMQMISYPFWEIDGLTHRELLPPDPEKSVYQPSWEELSAVELGYWHTPNDGSLEKADVESLLRRRLPMVNWDALLASIVPEYAALGDGRVSFQCSDGFGEEILSGAYDTLDETLAFLDWKNF